MSKPQEITATIFDKKGKILAKAKNSYSKTHPFQAKMAQKVGKPEKVFLHAEIHAIIKALKTGKQPYKILVERYHRDGTPALAEPCEVCKMAIKEAGISKIEYTI